MAANTYSLDVESGSSQYASCADSASLSITTAISIAAWVNFESLTGGEMSIAGKYDNGATSYLFMYNQTGTDSLQFYTAEGNIAIAWTPSTATWYHLAVTFDSTANEVKIYVDGAQLGTTQTLNNPATDTAARFAIGAYYTASTPQSFFDGKIDEVVVTSDVLTLTEIGYLYSGWDATEKLDNIAGYWKLNNDYLDETANNNDLTAGNAPSFTTTVPFANYYAETGGYFHMSI